MLRSVTLGTHRCRVLCNHRQRRRWHHACFRTRDMLCRQKGNPFRYSKRLTRSCPVHPQTQTARRRNVNHRGTKIVLCRSSLRVGTKSSPRASVRSAQGSWKKIHLRTFSGCVLSMSPTPKQPVVVAKANNPVIAVKDFQVFFIVFTHVLTVLVIST